MAEKIRYRDAELNDLQYIKIVYKDLDDKYYEVKTEVNYLSDNYISVYSKRTKLEDTKETGLDIDCPQDIEIKFVINDAMYTAQAVLQEIKIKPSRIYYRIEAPEYITLRQNRKYYRIDLKKLCMLVGLDKEGHGDAFLSRSINLSAGGILINQLESLTSSEFIAIDTNKYERYNMVVVLEMDRILKLSARYIRQEEGKKSYRYGFEFVDIDEDTIDFISKYVIKKQIEKLREENK